MGSSWKEEQKEREGSYVFNAMSGCGVVKFTRKGRLKEWTEGKQNGLCFALSAFLCCSFVFVFILLHCIPGPSEGRTFISSECRRGIPHMNLGALLQGKVR